MRYIGIDPGANLGLVCLDANERPRRIGNTLDVQWVESYRVHPGNFGDETIAENEGRLFTKLCVLLAGRCGTPLVAVLEEPSNHTNQWHGARKQATGTGFGLGKYYGLALAACTLNCTRVYSHPPTNDVKRQRTGWMQGSGRIPRREMLLWTLRNMAKHCGCPDPDALSEDEVMAFGVLKFHLDRYGIEKES